MRTFLNKSIVFDFDGTLIDISTRDYQVYIDVLKELKKQPIPFEIYWEKRRKKENIKDILALSEVLNEDEIDVFLRQREYRIDSKKYLLLDKLFDDVQVVLSKLKEVYSLYLVTSRYRKTETLEQIDNLGIAHYFDRIYVVGLGKYETFCQIPNLMYVIGDTENDIIPAKKMGVFSVAITTGIRSTHFLEDLFADYMVNNLEDFCRIALK